MEITDSIMRMEKERLKNTLELIDREIKSNEKKIDRLYENFDKKTDDPYLLENLSKLFYQMIRDLTKAKEKPYFARIDFKEKGKEKVEALYIGKSNVMDGTECVVIDWRAPVSSLYYDGRLGEVSYEAPEGTISGELLLKRLFEITNGELESISDIDIIANDELLQPYLSSNSDTRLKNIIATIQTEQNKIIRAPINTPLIVQGVAGSGKTTVALHRIAYLAYTYEKQIKPNDFMIIAPNKFFLDYISAVLPDLGVNDVKQVTFEEFAQEIIDSGIKVESANDKLANIVNNGKAQDDNDLIQRISSFKSSFDFKELLDKYLEDLEENYLLNEDMSIAGVTILSHDKLLENFKRFSINDISIEEKLTAFKNRLFKFFEDNIDKIEQLVIDKRRKELDSLDKSLPTELYKRKKEEIFVKYDPAMDALKKNGKKIIETYLKQIKRDNALGYYRDFISKLDFYVANDPNIDKSKIDKDLIRKIQQKLLENRNNKQVEYEDLTPLMYLTKRIKGTKKITSKERNMPKHIVIDEAQDYSSFQFLVLRDILQNNSMTILGDIAQGIYSYRGTKDWDEVNEKVFRNQANILNLSKSYRTTVEIMETGNNVISNISDKIKTKLGEPVIRKGTPVAIAKKEKQEQAILDISQRIENLLKDGSVNIAVITKTLQEAKELAKKINQRGVQTNLLSDKETNYKGGVTVLPSYLSKGLEFDSVIISNADEKEYGVNELDAKLLYIAITRAMHTLDIYYSEKMTPLLEERNINKETKNELYEER